EPIRQGDLGFAIGISAHGAVVEVLHIGRFNEGVNEVFIFRIERMINLEAATGLFDHTGNSHLAAEVACIAGVALSVKRMATREVAGIDSDAAGTFAHAKAAHCIVDVRFADYTDAPTAASIAVNAGGI